MGSARRHHLCSYAHVRDDVHVCSLRAAAPTVVAFNPIAVALEFFVGLNTGDIAKLDARGAVVTVVPFPARSPVLALVTHPVQPILFSGHANGHIRAVDLSTGACASEPAIRACMASTGCKPYVFRVSWDGSQYHRRERLRRGVAVAVAVAVAGRALYYVQAHDTEVTSLAVDAAGQVLVSTGECECTAV